MTELDQVMMLVRQLQGGKWQVPTLANGWVDYNAADAIRYRMAGTYVEFKGAIKGGTLAAGQLVMTLPGVKLTQRAFALVLVNGAVAPDYAGGLLVNTDGTCTQNWAWQGNVMVGFSSTRFPLI